MNLQPAIKWSGSKRLLADSIVALFPKEISNYYEPFCGGASILYNLLHKDDIIVDSYTISDKNKDLIDLLLEIKHNPSYLLSQYTILWNELNKDEDGKRKKCYYNEVREHFNRTRDSALFLFLLRTCYNGLTRYNSSGNFNTSFHFGRKGINPKKLDKVIKQWSELLNINDVTIKHCDYDTIEQLDNDDLMFLDPPYLGTTNTSMYNGGIDFDDFNNYIKHLDCKIVLSFDDSEKSHFDFLNHRRLDGKNSSFRRLKGLNTTVKESLYTNY